MKYAKIALVMIVTSLVLTFLFSFHHVNRFSAPNIPSESDNGAGKDISIRPGTRHVIEQNKTKFSNSPIQNPTNKQAGSRIHRYRVTPEEIDRRFYPKTLKSCKENNSSNLKTVDDWVNAFKTGKVKFTPLFKHNEYFFPWEKDYLSKPPLEDINLLPDLKFSSVWFLPRNKLPTLTTFVTGRKSETLSFRVDLVNSYGQQRLLGGDEVRAWVEGDPSTVSGMNYSASGAVTDLGNGSYVTTITPLWTGLTHLKISVVYPREYIRAALHHKRLGSYRYILGIFKQRKIKEVTVCHFSPNIPGRTCMCNLTHENTAPFYCGRPLDRRLTCGDLVSVKLTPKQFFRVWTPAEKILAGTMSRPAEKSLIKQNIVINVTENGDKDQVLKSCYKTDPRKTWEKQSPRGYWTKKISWTWTSAICHEPEIKSELVKRCLKSTQVIVIGDSNGERMFQILRRHLSCTVKKKVDQPNPITIIHRNEANNITVAFSPHKRLMFRHNQSELNYQTGGLRDQINSIPSTGKYVIIIHYYLHMTSDHLSGFYYQLVNLRNSLRKLLRRNREVIVGIRGPHISTVEWPRNHMSGGDVLGSFIIRMTHDVLKDLKRRVVFLDGWDMSIGLRNELFHTTNDIPKAMVRTLLAFKCQ